MARYWYCITVDDPSFKSISWRHSTLSNVMFEASLGLIGYSFWSTGEWPRGVSVLVSNIFLLFKIVDQKKGQGTPDAIYQLGTVSADHGRNVRILRRDAHHTRTTKRA
jgi:hypothetical protein